MFEKELKAAIEAGLKAKEGILKYYHEGFDVEIKSDDSPVTQADKNADKEIREYLHKLFPDYAFLTEESDDDLSRLNNDYVWIVDPVDGTKDFVAKDDQFTTNIALAYKHEVVVGVVVLPARNEYYYASKGNGAFHHYDGKDVKIHVNNKTSNLTVLCSRHHVNDKELKLIADNSNKITKKETYGSAMKPCRIAEGLAEITFRCSSGTKEWDTAASQIVVEEAGGYFLNAEGKRIMYNRVDVYNRDGYEVVNVMENYIPIK